jgi:hypothetical protein
MKVIFLDIDGVMKPGRCYFHELMSKDIDGGFDPLAVAIVNRLCAKTGAGIVFNTTWNHRFNTMEKAVEFGEVSDLSGKILGKTKYPGCERRVAIEDWLKNHAPEPVTHWVALDDCPSIKGDNAILIDGENGITIQNYRDATKILGGNDAFMVLI